MNNDNDIKTAIMENHKKWRIPRLIVATGIAMWVFWDKADYFQTVIVVGAGLLSFEFLIVQPYYWFKKLKNWLKNRRAKKRG